MEKIEKDMKFREKTMFLVFFSLKFTGFLTFFVECDIFLRFLSRKKMGNI